MNKAFENKMNALQGYRQWKELFDENVSNVWIGESIPALKNLSMIFFSLDREFKRIQKTLCSEVFQLRSHISQDKDTELGSELEFNQKKAPKRKNASSVLCEGIGHCADHGQLQPPNSFSPKEMSQDESTSIVISDEDKSEVPNSSPEIKKKYRHSDFRKKINRKRKTVQINNGSFTPSELHLRSLIDVQSKNASCTEKKGENKEGNNISLEFLDKFPASYKRAQCKSPGVWLSDRNNEIIDTTQKPADVDFSIVQCTPLKRKEVPSNFLKNRSRRKISSTLMQTSLEKHEDGEIEKYIRAEDFKENSSLNSAMLEDSSSEPEEPSKGLNDFLEKAQNVPIQLETEPIVKGKARKNLPGWSCKECEKFYLKQGLNSDEILVLNKCSKHRGYYKPREDTLPGFWDMDVSSQTENI